MTIPGRAREGGYRSPVVIAGDIENLEGDLAISAVTVAELHFGVLVAHDAEVRAERLRRLTLLRGRFEPLPVDDDVASSYGQIAAAVVEVGHNPRARALDLLIAATAHAHSARLYTRIAADLSGAEHLVEIVPV